MAASTESIDAQAPSVLLPEGTCAPQDTQPAPTTSFESQLDDLISGRLSAAIHFQPIVDLAHGMVTGYEALSRFPREIGLPPNVCFEKAGVLGRRLELEQLTCASALKGRHFLPPNCFLTVNVGPAFLVSSEWQRVLRDTSDLSGVVVEVTEETLVESYDSLRRQLNLVRTMGGLVAVDDCGAGYASLQHVLEMKPDFIKLDRSFVQNCHTDRAKSALIEMMGAAANRLDAWIIAEGVELVSEMEELIRLGVPLAQGYLLARPKPDMEQIPAAVSEAIQNRNSRGNRYSTLQTHVRACERCTSVEAAFALLRNRPELRAVVVTDEWGRPVEVVEVHPLVGMRQLPPGFMRTQADSEPAEVLQRALTREAPCRFDPVVVIGPEGQTVGLIAVDLLMAAVMGRKTVDRRQNVH